MNKRIDLRLLLILLLAAWFVLLLTPAYADDDCRGNHNCTGGGDPVTATASASGTASANNQFAPTNTTTAETGPISYNNESRALALGNSLGDVDIAQCLGSTQWSTPVFSKQKLVVNWPCMAEFYLRNGAYKQAAIALCNTEIVDDYANEDECRAAHDFQPVTEPAPVSAALYSEQVALREQVEALQQQLVVLRDKPAPAPVVRREVQQVGMITEERKQAVLRALEKEND